MLRPWWCDRLSDVVQVDLAFMLETYDPAEGESEPLALPLGRQTCGRRGNGPQPDWTENSFLDEISRATIQASVGLRRRSLEFDTNKPLSGETGVEL